MVFIRYGEELYNELLEAKNKGGKLEFNEVPKEVLEALYYYNTASSIANLFDIDVRKLRGRFNQLGISLKNIKFNEMHLKIID